MRHKFSHHLTHKWHILSTMITWISSVFQPDGNSCLTTTLAAPWMQGTSNATIAWSRLAWLLVHIVSSMWAYSWPYPKDTILRLRLHRSITVRSWKFKSWIIYNLLNRIDARWNGAIIGQGGPSNAQLADIWKQLAQKYASQSRIIFGIMNEPHDGKNLHLFPRTAVWRVTTQSLA